MQKMIPWVMAAILLVGCSAPSVSPVAPSDPPEASTALPTTTLGAPTTPTAEASVTLPTVTPTPITIDLAAMSFAVEPVLDGLERPVLVTHAGDGSGRLFVVEKPGRIRIAKDGVLMETPFLDLSEQINSRGNEQGLLGLAFAPDYSTNGRFWVNYTDLAGDTVVASFQTSDNPDLADPLSASTVLTITQPAPNHNGGMIAFGPDGMLWIGMGDGGAANDRFGNGQNPASLLGKLLRVDVTSAPSRAYTIPADNPWLAADWNGEDVRDEVWALGLRNPWRFSFDRQTGDLWLADVGQNLWEEINWIPGDSPGGLNFGWPIMEGTHCFASDVCSKDGLTLPVLEYSHGAGCSVIGGHVYRGQMFPMLNGVYFYADYCSGALWAAIADADGVWRSTKVLDTGLTVSSFGEDEAGELYIIDDGGQVVRLAVE
jgi:glucose/arabinose dehydrogenase